MRAIDVHAHFYPASYLALLEEAGYPPGTIYSNRDPGMAGEQPGTTNYTVHDAAFTDLGLRIAAMDRQRVTVHAVSVPPPYVFAGDGELLIRLARAYNDAASAAHAAYPDRIVGLATLPVHDPGAALAELERARALPGIRGVSLGTRFAERDLSDPDYWPLYARIAALGLPIFIHYAPLTVIGSKDRLGRFHLSNLIGNTTETAIAAAHLIFGGVLDAFPALEVSLPHSGGVFPILAGRFDQGHRVRAECSHLPHPPSHYLQRFTYDTVCHSSEVMAYLLRIVGAERIVLGSDYCFDMGEDHPVEMVERLTGIDARQRADILGHNAARLLGITE